MFRAIELTDWRQFGEFRLELDNRLTVLTGANGTGKTTILRLLAQHFGWPGHLVGTPSNRDGEIVFRSDVRRPYLSQRDEVYAGNVVAGRIEYTNGKHSDIVVNARTSEQYVPQLMSPEPEIGIMVTSHRLPFTYQRVAQIPTTVNPTESIYQSVLAEARAASSPGVQFVSPSFRMKETLISWAMFGPGNQIVSPNPVAMHAFSAFESVLRSVLPKELRFGRLAVEMPEVVLHTETGTFSLDAVSGGVGAIIDLCWHVFLFTLSNPQQPFTLIIDEPENHLHPSLQREILPRLMDGFPFARIIASTHSPFIVGADRDAAVYAFNFGPRRGRVVAELLDFEDKSGTANDILRRALGLESTTPKWVEESLDKILRQFEASNLSPSSIEELQQQLEKAGLSDFAPQATAAALKNLRSTPGRSR